MGSSFLSTGKKQSGIKYEYIKPCRKKTLLRSKRNWRKKKTLNLLRFCPICFQSLKIKTVESINQVLNYFPQHKFSFIEHIL